MSAELESLLRVSHAVAHGQDLRATLDRVAREAARVVGARSASILLRQGYDDPFEIVGAYRLGRTYHAAIEHPSPVRLRSPGPSWLAMEQDTQVVVEDTLTDPRYAPWRSVARREGYRGFVSTPLHNEDQTVVGSLDVYRETAGSWEPAELQLLSLFVRHAAAALQTARLIDHQRQQLLALRHVVRTLEEQSHEHANRLHTIHGLIAIGEHEHVKEFVSSLQSARKLDRLRISERVDEPAIRGLLVAKTAIAEQRGIALEVTDRSRIASLPPTVDEATAVTILGNLLDNAFDAVAECSRRRRKVVVSFSATSQTTAWRVRDYGRGIPDAERPDMFRRGVSDKAQHLGLGLYLVAEAVTHARGTISVRHLAEGTSFTVRLPLQA